MSDSSPFACVLDGFVRADDADADGCKEGDVDFVPLQGLRILRSVEKKFSVFSHEGYETFEADANELVQSMDIGVGLAGGPPAGAPPGLSCVVLRGCSPFADIEAVDKNVIVLEAQFCVEFAGIVYLVYDALKESLRMIPLPEVNFTLSTRVLIVRPDGGGHENSDYVLVQTVKRDADHGEEERDSLLLWRPSAPSSFEFKDASFPVQYSQSSYYEADTVFSSNGHCYFADLLGGVMHCSRDAILDGGNDRDSVVRFGFIDLPVVHEPGIRHGGQVAQPKAYRTMSAVQGSVKFVSVDGFSSHVDLKDRTLTVWRLKSHAAGWEEEHVLVLKDLWELDGFKQDLPKDLTPMQPLLSTDDEDVVCFVLGECHECSFRDRRKFLVGDRHYLLAVDMRNKIIRGSIHLADCFRDPHTHGLVSYDFSSFLCKKAQLESHGDGGDEPDVFDSTHAMKKRRC